MLGFWIGLGVVVALIVAGSIHVGRRGSGRPADHREGEGSAMGALAFFSRGGGGGGGVGGD